MPNVQRLKNKRVLNYGDILAESVSTGISLLRLLYDRYIPVIATGDNTGIYEVHGDIIIKWN